jgi:branched-chain amino acid transport system permease protein
MSASAPAPEQEVEVLEENTSVLDAPAATGLGPRTLLVGAVVAIATLVLGLLVPSVLTNSYYMGLAADGVTLAILASGIGFLAHRSGLLSLGHTAFYGGAAYGVAISMAQWGWGPGTAALFGVVGGTVLAAVIGSLAIRLTGFGFLMLTLAFSQALYLVSLLTSLRSVTGAFDGLTMVYADPNATLFGLTQADFGSPDKVWPIGWVCLVLVVFVLWLVGRSRFGVILEAIRENEERARFSGFDTFFPRLIAFTLSGACASIAGALFALRYNYVSPEVLSFVTAGDALIAVLVGGFTLLIGPVVGAGLYVYASAKFGVNIELYMGTALIIAVVFLPGGITGSIADWIGKLRRMIPSRGGAK